MKQLFYITAFLLLATTSFALTPELLYLVDINSTDGNNAAMAYIDDTHLAIFDKIIGVNTCRLRIVNPETGIITDQATTGECSGIVGIDYEGGTIAACFTDAIGAERDNINIYKLPGDGFMTLKKGVSASTTSAGFNGCVIDSSSSTRADVFISGFATPSSYYGIARIFFNTTPTQYIAYSVRYPDAHLFKQLYDEEAMVFGTSNDFVNNSNPYNHTTGGPTDTYDILDSLVLGDTLKKWNFNSDSPLWITENGHLVLVTDYTDVLESSGSVSMDEFLAIAGQSEVYGLIDDDWYKADFTNAASPTLTNLGLSVPNYGNITLDGILTTSARVFYLNTSQSLSSWVYSEAGVPTQNSPPEFSMSFLGTDVEQENFYFKALFEDADGGLTYYGIDLNKFPYDFLNESVAYLQNFNDESDLSEVSTISGCEDTLGITYDGGPSGYATGAVYINESCAVPLFVTLPTIVKTDDLTFDKVVLLDTQFTIRDSFTGSTIVDSSFSLVSSNELYLFYLFFDVEGGLVNISYVDTSLQDVQVVTNYNASFYQNDYRVYTEIDMDAETITFHITDDTGNIILNDTVVPFIQNGIGDLSYIRYGEARDDGALFVDYYQISYDADIAYPDYALYSYLDANKPLYKSLSVPIPDGGAFGSFKATLFGTDSVLGFDYHENPYIVNFDFDEDTESYTQAEINEIIFEENSALPIEDQLVEGDWLTSIYNFFELYGIKTQGSKFLLGLFLWILIALPAASAAGPEVGLVAGIVGFITLSYIGLFPTWFIIIMIIVSAAIMFLAFRKLAQG